MLPIKHLTLVNGSAPKERGGAIRLNKGRLTVTDAIFSNNQAESGGAIASGENTYLKIYNSRFSFNTAAAQGGALFYSGCIHVDTTVFFKQNSSILGKDDSRREISIAEPPRLLHPRNTCMFSLIHFLTD